jgi:adenine-specific DNA methylase
MDQRFIEYDLPLAEISEESAREKNIRHGHPSTLHIWWARRPLASSRATTLAALLDDPGPHEPDKRREIRELIKEITPWEAVKNGNSAAIKRAQQLVREQYTDDDGTHTPPKVLDPFAGGGSIPLEALRLGAETYASDYNPVAVFIEKATLEWPQKFGIEIELPEDEDDGSLGMGGKKVNLLAYLVEKWANIILEEAREEIGQFYPTETGEGLVGKREVNDEQEGWTPVGYLWARTIPCQNPTCGATIPLIKQFWLAKKKNKKIAYRPVVDTEAETIDFELLADQNAVQTSHGGISDVGSLDEAMADGFDPKDGTVSRANASCPVCGQVTKAKQVRQLACDGHMGERMVAVVLHHPDEVGKKYRLATDDDVVTYEAAAEHLDQVLDEWPHPGDPLPTETIPTYELRRIALPLYGMEKWSDLFNARQKLALLVLFWKIGEAQERITEEIASLPVSVNDEALSQAVTGCLAIATNRYADYNTSIQSWETLEKFGHTFGRQALPMAWDYAEGNPFSGSAGCWENQLEWVRRFIENNDWTPEAPATAQRSSATDLPHADDTLDAIITDPPYYDNVPYAALADFFYVWLKRSVGEHFPELFSTPLIPKTAEIVHDRPHERSDSIKTKEHFEKKLGESFQEMHRVLKPDGVAVIVYAHKTTEGWETMLNGLVEAGFVVTGSWPIHTEMKSRLVAAQTAALASSIYMVCRKTEREELGFWNDIQPQIKARVEEKLQQFWDADVIRGGDFFISAIGPGMEAYSRYDEVQSYSGETITVADLLQYIRGIATDFLVQRLLRGVSSGAIDKEAQFYLTYRWTFRNERVEYDDALRIAKAEGVNLDRLADTDTFIKKTRKYVYVHGPQDRDAVGTVHNMVDAMHGACLMWSSGDKEAVGPMLAQYGYHQNPSFWQLCQGVAECLPNGNKEKQWLEGMLMSKDQYQQAESSGLAPGGSGGQTEMAFEDE